MLCQHCQKRIANVHFTQVINSNKVELYLCEQCAKEKGKLTFGNPFQISDFFSGIIGVGDPAAYMESPVKQEVCDKCGMSYDEFQKLGKLGCSTCYKLFGDRLLPLVKRLHGSVEHHGKTPEKLVKTIESVKEMEALKQKLNDAIGKEEYEKAAELRDKIRKLEAEK
jgi:protein arginine kinase activator